MIQRYQRRKSQEPAMIIIIVDDSTPKYLATSSPRLGKRQQIVLDDRNPTVKVSYVC